MTSWTIPRVLVLNVEERKRSLHVSGTGADAIFRLESVGWFAQFEGSYESLFLGTEKPDLDKGDRVNITITKAP